MALGDFRADYLSFLDPSYADEQSPDYQRPRGFTAGGSEGAKRKVLADTLPETQNPLSRMYRGALHDLRDFGEGLGSMAALGLREGVRVAQHPVQRVSDYLDFAGQVANDPSMVVRGAKALGSAMVEPYIPREGESGFDTLTRNVLDRPLGTMMDAAAVVGAPASLAAKAGIPGAARLAAAVAEADPISLASRALRSGPGAAIAETAVPDAVARMNANKIIADATSEATLRASAADQQFEAHQRAIFGQLDDSTKPLFFPYVEGRLKAMSPESGMAGQVAELRPTGQWQPRALDPAKLDSLEQARQAYLPVVDMFEEMRGLSPDRAALDYGASEHRAVLKEGGDPLAPENIQRIQAKAEEGRAKASAAQIGRRTVSTRTALDAAKTAQFQKELEGMRLEGATSAADEHARAYPPTPTTPEEALAVMGPQGGVYFPHSGEVFTREQSTVGNLLTKVRESIPWKTNEGALFRSGALDTMDPEKALARTWIALRGGKGLSEIADQLGSQLGERLAPGFKVGTDPELRAGTHQLIHPALLHQEGALEEHMRDLTQRLLDHGNDPATAALSLSDLYDQASKRIDTTFPLRKDTAVYKVPKGVADAFAHFRRSFEPSTNPMVNWLDKTADPFNFVTLNLRPARILNNVVGNTLFQVMQGIHPFSTRGLGAIADMAQAGLARAGLPSTERGAKLAKVFDLPGVSTGGLSAMGRASRTEAFLASREGVLGAPARGVAALGSGLAGFNEKVENTARALSTIFELRKEAPSMWSRALGNAKNVIDTGDRVEQLAKAGAGALDDAGYRTALGSVNHFLNDYTRATPLERTMWRRIFPYEKFYRHAVSLALKYPFEAPAQGALMRSIGKSAMTDVKEQLNSWGFDWDSMVPESMRHSVPVDVVDDPQRGRQVRMLNTQGPNPFSVLAADPSAQGIGALHPAVKAAIESVFGLNLWTMERFQGNAASHEGKELDPSTGALVDSMARPGPLSNFAKQFFPVQVARDLVAGGRVPLDTASLMGMIHASVTGHEGEAFKTNDRGVAERRPYHALDPFVRLLAPVPQTLEAPTRSQAAAQKSQVSDLFNQLGREYPELRETLRARLRAAAPQVRAERAARPRIPFRRP